MTRIAFEAVKRGGLPLAIVLSLYALQVQFRYDVRGIEESIHLAGGMAAAHFCSRALSVLEDFGLAGRIPRGLRSLLVFCSCATAAVFWEFGEYLAGMTGPYDGLQDTIGDLAYGVAGGAAFVLGAQLVRLGRVQR